MSEDKQEIQQESLTTAEVAGLIKATWTALLAPKWPKDDLIDLGKLIYAKVPLSKIDADLYGRLRPHLMTVAQELGKHVMKMQLNEKHGKNTEATPPEQEKKDG